MKKLLVVFLAVTCSVSFAQSPVSTRLSSGVDVGAAFKNDYTHSSLTYFQLLNLDQRKIFSLGWTTKLAAFYGDNLNYTTAPARLSRGETGFNALTAPLIPANLDTMRFDWVTVNSLNFGLRAQINLGPVQLGASTDILGIAFGKRRTGRYISSNGRFEAATDSLVAFTGTNVQQTVRPQGVNLRLLGDNDFGTLVSEVFVRVQATRRVGIKVGYHWITTEIKADRKNTVDKNNRFRNRASMPYVALTFPFF